MQNIFSPPYDVVLKWHLSHFAWAHRLCFAILSTLHCIPGNTLTASTTFFRPNLIFKQNHHFSTNIIRTKETWFIRNVSTAVASNPELSDIHDFETLLSSTGITIMGRYSFHIPIYKKWGYYLGSQAGVASHQIDNPRVTSTPSWVLPGVEAGLTYYMNKSMRMNVHLEWYLERINGLIITNHNQTRQIRLSMHYENQFDLGGSGEYFWNDTHGIRFEYRKHTLKNLPPVKRSDNGLSSQGKLENIRIERQTFSIGLGYVYYFG
ncbi:MAG: hypothetical protein OXT67_01260 [Zetaproteobacteria bacterium]|nr:hypothetical protein [Zetaproteobacteria bacterium]